MPRRSSGPRAVASLSCIECIELRRLEAVCAGVFLGSGVGGPWAARSPGGSRPSLAGAVRHTRSRSPPSHHPDEVSEGLRPAGPAPTAVLQHPAGTGQFEYLQPRQSGGSGLERFAVHEMSGVTRPSERRRSRESSPSSPHRRRAPTAPPLRCTRPRDGAPRRQLNAKRPRTVKAECALRLHPALGRWLRRTRAGPGPREDHPPKRNWTASACCRPPTPTCPRRTSRVSGLDPAIPDHQPRPHLDSADVIPPRALDPM